MTKTISTAKTLKGKRKESSVFLKDLIESRVEEEEKLIDDINADFGSKRDDVFRTLDTKKAKTYLNKERQSFDAFFDRFGKNAGRLESMKAPLRKEIKKKALRRFPELKEIARLNSQHIDHLHHALHSGPLTGVHNPELMDDLDLVLPDVRDYDLFEPPYDLSDELNVGEDFDRDDSFTWADWGTLTQIVQFSQNQSWTEFSGPAYRYAWNSVALGVNYRMPTHGALDITVVLKNFDNRIDFSITDNFGPSEAGFDIENIIFIPVSSGGLRKHLHSVTMLHESRQSAGDDISDSINPIAYNTPFLINFRTDHIHEGQDVQIMVASWLRVYSTVNRMRAQINANLFWKVDRIYLMVV